MKPAEKCEVRLSRGATSRNLTLKEKREVAQSLGGKIGPVDGRDPSEFKC